MIMHFLYYFDNSKQFQVIMDRQNENMSTENSKHSLEKLNKATTHFSQPNILILYENVRKLLLSFHIAVRH